MPETTELTTIIQEEGIEPAKGQCLLMAYSPLFTDAAALCDAAGQITVTDATQVTEIKASREMRMRLRHLRGVVEETRKSLKAGIVREGKAIDGMANVLKFKIEPIEERLLAQEQFAERAEAARKSAIRQEREAQLTPYGWDTAHFQLADMTEPVFQQLLANTKLAHEKQQEEARAAEASRIAAEARRAEEDRLMRAENERLRLEAVERERAAKEAEAAFAAQRAAAEAKAAAEREAAKREYDAKIAAEKAIAAENAAKAAKLEAAEKERKRVAAAEAKAKRAAALAPDKDKLAALATAIRGLPFPTVEAQEAKDVLGKLRGYLGELADRLIAAASNL